MLYDFVIFRMERRGGISRYVAELARRLAGVDGVETTIFAGLHDNDFVADRQFTRGVRLIGRRSRSRVARSSLGGGIDYAAMRAYQYIPPRHSIYHPSYYPRAIRCPRGTRLVATVYDMIHERIPEFHRGDPTPSRKRALVDAADLILCISETTARDLTTLYGVDPARIRVTYLGAGSGEWHARPVPRLAIGEGRPYVLYVGRRSGYKNFRMLLEAYIASASLHRATALVAVGGGEWSSEEQGILKRAPAEARVIRTDADEAELQALYAGALALAVPSLYEGFGLPVVEAMREGCAVVANATGSLPEIVGDAGLVVPLTDPGVLADHLERVLGDDVLHGRLRDAGRARASRFDWDSTAAKTLAAYRDVVGAG
ncbi:MAG: glycosyltransferase family 4 protein [Gemmatimonadaceae bacterium]|nr:glycosyltransferase family 4 protein [Gemmatimonadaceae bacterium]NUQ93654.1 glycosyltransferase family 4 protein [Gemmatimonadaceae bacterium]NUS96906.1 glycosyltransferase family 4 protein [Gemmatimonadaceae bacterium]